jgi:hypothetical protein
MKATVTRPYYDWDGRKYIEVRTEAGTILRAKVPFRYGRVMCRCAGLKTVQEFQVGDTIECEFEKKIWDGQVYWILISASERTQ